MGGTVSMTLALTHPERTLKVTVVGSPIVGSSLSLLLKLSGYQAFARLLYGVPGLLSASIHVLSMTYAQDWRTLWQMLRRDLSRTTVDSFSRSIRDLREMDLRPRLPECRAPAMGIYGRKDNIVDPEQGEVIRMGVPQATIHYFERSGHFPMLDEPDRFHQVIYDFLIQDE